MRSVWRAIVARRVSQASPNISRIETLTPQVRPPQPPNPSLSSPPWFLAHQSLQNPRPRHLSAAPSIDHEVPDHARATEILAKPLSPDEIKAELSSLNPSLDEDAVNSILRSLAGRPDAARSFFDWVAESDSQKLRSKSYNTMLTILGRKGWSDQFWALVTEMKRKGYGISREACLEVSNNFRSEEMESDLEKLKEVRPLKVSDSDVAGTPLAAVCKILKKKDEAGVIRGELEGLDVALSTDLVFAVLERIGQYPDNALVFFRWAEEKSLKIDGRVYNSIARALATEARLDEQFWGVLRKMRGSGYEMERKTYVAASSRYYRENLIAGAVEVYEFAMGGSDKPSLQEFMFVLRNIVVSSDPDMGLISKAVRIFVDAGNPLKRSSFTTVLTALKGVGRVGECDKFLKAMEEGGFVADDIVHEQVVRGLYAAKRFDEATEYLGGSGRNTGTQPWKCLIDKLSLAGELDKAVSCFRKMVERKGGENVGSAFEVLVTGFCQKNKPLDALKLLKEMGTKKNLTPLHSTYKFLIEKLLSQGRVTEASSVLGLMKNHGFPPFINPFIEYVSKSGTVEDAMGFLKAMTVKEFPSKEVFIRLFEALSKTGRHEVARDILSKSPGSVRNHADVLNLFYSMKLAESPVELAV